MVFGTTISSESRLPFSLWQLPSNIVCRLAVWVIPFNQPAIFAFLRFTGSICPFMPAEVIYIEDGDITAAIGQVLARSVNHVIISWTSSASFYCLFFLVGLKPFWFAQAIVGLRDVG